MQRHFLRIILVTVALSLISCAGVGVVATSDPKVKLSDAINLFSQQDRPLIAERLIREAIEICQPNADQECLAAAYWTYGVFFRSPSLEGHWSKIYKESGFLDKSATYDNRYAKSVEYFKKARDIYGRLEQFDHLTNANLNIGFVYELMGEHELACRAFDESSANHRENIRRNPTAKVKLPQGFASYDDYLAIQMKRVGCD